MDGISPEAAPSPHKADCVQAWILPCPPPAAIENAAWLAASVPADRVTVGNWDLAAAVDTAAPAERDALRAAFAASLAPFSAYRSGQYRRPEALVAGGISSDRLTLLTDTDGGGCRDNERAYARQLRRLLRAMIGAPEAVPLDALVAAAVARGRAAPVAVHRDNERHIRTYRLDGGSAYFAFDAALSDLVGRDEINTAPG